MRHATSCVAAALLFAATSLPAMAQYYSEGVYVFGNVGQAKADLDGEPGSPGVSSSVEEEDTAYKLGLGLQLNPYFAIEGAWVDLGEYSYKAWDNDGNFKSDVEVSGFGANLVGRLPLDYDLSLYAKAGWHQLDVDTSSRLNLDGVGSFSESNDDSDSVGSWAVGGAWEFAPQFSVVAEFERYLGVGDDDLTDDEIDIDFWSIGLRYDLL